jgi:opacity protein-like surface antigen
MDDLVAIKRRLRSILVVGFAWLTLVGTARANSPETMEQAPGDAASTGGPVPLAARKGFSITFQFIMNLIGAADPGPGTPSGQLFIDEVGGGGQLGLAYAFTPHFSLGLALAVAGHRTSQSDVEAVHSSFTIDARYEFLSHERARPYLLAGVGGTTLALARGDLESEVKGGVALLGAGLVYQLTRHFALDFGARLDQINWTEVRVTQQVPGGSEIVLEDPVDDEGAAVKFLLGAGWKF